MKGILSQIIMPLPLFFLLITAGFFFLWRKKKAWKILLLVAWCWLLFVSTRPVPAALVRHLEYKYKTLSQEQISELPDSVNIIVLGGGHADDMNLPPNDQLSTIALGRMVEGVRIYKGTEHSLTRHVGMAGSVKIIVSGYAGKGKISQAEVLYRNALMLGVDSSALIVSSKSSNTEEEAREYLRLCGSSRKLVIVTSAIHMPRAMMIFKSAGIDVIPAPTNHLIKYGSVKNKLGWVPSAGNISMMEQAMHEYVGILWVEIRHKSSGD
jgi:uncharacterized SAM-binding protein YcdF (DUF218 family)